MHTMLTRLAPIGLAAFTLALLTPSASSQALSKEHLRAYERAMDHTLDRLPRASFAAKMIMGWALLADGRQNKELDRVLSEALQWKQRAGTKKANNHRANWYPALAGLLIGEASKSRPRRDLREGLQEIVDHFAAVQERTGGWFKWYEGAYNDRPDYPVKDLGILNAIVLGILHTARAQGLEVPAKVLEGAETCVGSLLSGRGISYGTGSRGGDKTGARGAFALWGLSYARERRHPIVKTYQGLLPRLIPNLDQGHHVGGLHCLGVALGCRIVDPKASRQLVQRWAGPWLDKQEQDGGVYVGDDEDAGGEVGLIGEDDASTAAVAFALLLQDASRWVPGTAPNVNWTALSLPATKVRGLDKVDSWAASSKLDKVLDVADKVLDRGDRAKDDELDFAGAARQAVHDLLEQRLEDIDRSLDECDAIRADEITRALRDALGQRPEADALSSREARLKHPEMAREHEAQQALAKAWQQASKKGWEKAQSSFESVSTRYEGTRAGERALDLLRPADLP